VRQRAGASMGVPRVNMQTDDEGRARRARAGVWAGRAASRTVSMKKRRPRPSGSTRGAERMPRKIPRGEHMFYQEETVAVAWNDNTEIYTGKVTQIDRFNRPAAPCKVQYHDGKVQWEKEEDIQVFRIHWTEVDPGASPGWLEMLKKSLPDSLEDKKFVMEATNGFGRTFYKYCRVFDPPRVFHEGEGPEWLVEVEDELTSEWNGRFADKVYWRSYAWRSVTARDVIGASYAIDWD